MNSKLYNILKGLINESVDSNSVLDAIRNKYFVRIKYNDGQGDGVGNGSRVIAPMAIGTTKKGYPVMRAFQEGGDSRSGSPNWKFFRLDRVMSWRPMKRKHYYAPPDDKYGEYNYNGDRSMSHFVDNAKFDNLSDPLVRARMKTQQLKNAPKVNVKNTSGPVAASQQTKKNVFTSQPNSKKYQAYAKNIKDTENDIDRFNDDIWAKAEQERDMQNTAPKPPSNTNGPIINNDYDVSDVDFNEDDFPQNSNNRRNRRY